MNEFKTEKAVYTPEDFLLWQQNGMLEITPKFQRRPVWRTPARSVITSNFTRLGHFAATRHRIVHDQQDAKLKFDVATQHFAGRTFTASRPGKFLRDYRTSKGPTQRWLGVIATELGALLSQMV